jgi:hypothetical protein
LKAVGTILGNRKVAADHYPAEVQGKRQESLLLQCMSPVLALNCRAGR